MSRQHGDGANQHSRPRSRSGLDDTMPWPPRLPPMRSLPPLRGIAQRDYEDNSPSPSSMTASSSSLHSRIPYMSSNAAVRAERIRNLQGPDHGSQQSFSDNHSRSSAPWASARWGYDRRGNNDRQVGNTLYELDHSIDDLDEANSRLRALLDLTNSPSDPPRTSANDSIPAEPSSLRISFTPSILRPNDLPDDSNRRHKRRKVDAERQLSNFKGFRYGKYGQLEPGKLQMEMVSCDGGMYSNRQMYSADNILKDDDQVYCTKSNRCNIVLRHQGATAFTLQELVIKAPASMNYSHPVREGMVFITMEQDEALSRTARYQVQYTNDPVSHAPSCPHAAADDENVAGNVHPFSQAFDRELRRVLIRRRGPGAPETGSLHRRYHYPGVDSDDEDDAMSTTIHADPHQRISEQLSRRRATTISSARRRRPSMPSEFSANHPDFQITTECSDDEDDGADAGGPFSSSRRNPWPAAYRIGSLPFENPDSDSENDHITTVAADISNTQSNNSTGNGNSNDLSQTPSDSLLEAWEAHDRATQDAVRAVGGGQLLVPHARFFIEKRKSKCTIRFDPPVSGRFILLKMWSSHHEPGGNIDIQSVIARGFAGPRYFPSVELR